MSPVTIVIVCELRSVSVGCRSGLGWIASFENVRVHPVSATTATRARSSAISSAWLDAPRPSTKTYQPASMGVGARSTVRGDQRSQLAEWVGNVGPVDHTIAARQVDRAQHLVRTIDVVVDDQVPVLNVVAELFPGLRDPPVDHVGSVGRASA